MKFKNGIIGILNYKKSESEATILLSKEYTEDNREDLIKSVLASMENLINRSLNEINFSTFETNTTGQIQVNSWVQGKLVPFQTQIKIRRQLYDINHNTTFIDDGSAVQFMDKSTGTWVMLTKQVVGILNNNYTRSVFKVDKGINYFKFSA